MKRIEVPARDGGLVELTSRHAHGGAVWVKLRAARGASVDLLLLAHEARMLAYVLHSLDTKPVGLPLDGGDWIEVAPWGVEVMLTGTRNGVTLAVTIAHLRVPLLEEALFELADNARFNLPEVVA